MTRGDTRRHAVTRGLWDQLGPFWFYFGAILGLLMHTRDTRGDTRTLGPIGTILGLF